MCRCGFRESRVYRPGSRPLLRPGEHEIVRFGSLGLKGRDTDAKSPLAISPQASAFAPLDLPEPRLAADFTTGAEGSSALLVRPRPAALASLDRASA